MAVKEKLLQGGGLGPVVGGEDHLPVEGKVIYLIIYEVLNSLSAQPRYSLHNKAHLEQR